MEFNGIIFRNYVTISYLLARLLFPLTFLLFNLLYWTHYAGKGGKFDWTDHRITGNIQ